MLRSTITHVIVSILILTLVALILKVLLTPSSEEPKVSEVKTDHQLIVEEFKTTEVYFMRISGGDYVEQYLVRSPADGGVWVVGVEDNKIKTRTLIFPGSADPSFSAPFPEPLPASQTEPVNPLLPESVQEPLPE